MAGTSILKPLTNEMKRKILKAFWCIVTEDLDRYELFFSYYEDVCRGLGWGRGMEYKRLAGKNHEDIAVIIDVIWKSGEKKTCVLRPELRSILKGRNEFLVTDDSALNASISLALRLWTTINFREDEDFDDSPGSVQWNDTTRLNEFIASQFVSTNEAIPTGNPMTDTSPETAQKVGTNIDPQFSASNLLSLHGIRTKVTPNINDHLIYRDDKEQGKVLWVFLSKPFLEAHRTNNTKIFPMTLLSETNTTLGILFPSTLVQEHKRTTAYLKKYHPGICDPNDDPFSWPDFERPLISSFVYWHYRLDTIHKVYKSKPTSFWYRTRDFRDPQEWMTFWMGLVVILVMTFFFGCISAATSIASAVYAYEGLVIAREGLAIAKDASSSAAASASLASASATIVSTVADVTTRAISKQFK